MRDVRSGLCGVIFLSLVLGLVSWSITRERGALHRHDPEMTMMLMSTPSAHHMTHAALVDWQNATAALVRAGSGGGEGTYGDASNMRDGVPSLYATAWWACARDDLPARLRDRRQGQATREWLNTLVLPDGKIGSSTDPGLPLLYRITLLARAYRCLGASLPVKWTASALRQLQASDGRFSWEPRQHPNTQATVAAAEMLGTQSTTVQNGRVGWSLYLTLERTAHDDQLFHPTSVQELLDQGGIAVLAGLGSLRLHAERFSLTASRLRWMALERVRAQILTQPPTGLTLSIWQTLREASRLFAASLHPTPAYLRMLAGEQLTDGTFPFARGQTSGEVQTTARAVALLSRGGLHLSRAAELATTEQEHRSATGGWAIDLRVIPNRADTQMSLAILDRMNLDSHRHSFQHPGLQRWIERMWRTLPAQIPQSLAQRAFWMHDAFSALAAAQETHVPEQEIRQAARVLASVTWVVKPGGDFNLIKGMFWQSAAQALAGVPLTISPRMLKMATDQVVMPKILLLMPPTLLLQVAAVRLLATPGETILLAQRVLSVEEQHRTTEGGYAARAGMPADLLSTRAALAAYALFQRPVPQPQAAWGFIGRCVDQRGGFSAQPQRLQNNRLTSLISTWAGLSSMSLLTRPWESRDHDTSWIQRIWDVIW